jgi:Outer membrane protein beta-barrel domain
MKKGILLITAFFLSLLTFAQGKASYGVKGGFSSSRMEGEALNSLDNLMDFTGGRISTASRTGFFAGGNVSIPVSQNFSIEPGLYYAQKGYEMKGDLQWKAVDFLGAAATAKLDAQYIDLPLLLKANMGGFQVFAGPQVSYLVNADLKTRAGILGINLLNKSWDVSDQYNRWDAGITGGIGYQFKNGVSLSAAYDHGLSRVDANKSLEAYNRAFKVGLGMNF